MASQTQTSAAHTQYLVTARWWIRVCIIQPPPIWPWWPSKYPLCVWVNETERVMRISVIRCESGGGREDNQTGCMHTGCQRALVCCRHCGWQHQVMEATLVMHECQQRREAAGVCVCVCNTDVVRICLHICIVGTCLLYGDITQIINF